MKETLQLKAYLALEDVVARFGTSYLADRWSMDARTIDNWAKQKPIKSAGMVLDACTCLLKELEDREPEQAEFTFIDLFAGIGGTRVGFERAGGRCVFTSEWDRFAQETYRANFPPTHAIAGDITKIDEHDIPDHDVLIGGFPCQPFSLAGVSKKNSLGRAHGFACDTQGTLFFDIARILEAKRPKAFMLENVKNLASHDKGKTLEIIMRTLERELGYRVSTHFIDGQKFVPQHRERVYIVGLLEGQELERDEVFLPEGEGPRLSTILHPEDGSEEPEGHFTQGPKARVNDKYVLSDKLWSYLQAYAEKHRQKGNGFGFSCVGPEDVARTLSARYHKDGSEILVSRGKRKNPRRLTPRECARLMGFGNDFEIPVSDTQAYRQFGNSVVVPAVEAVARAMKPRLLKAASRTMEKIAAVR